MFALPVAYTFTVIVASLVYQDTSTSYLSGIDDDTSVTRGGPDVGGNCFILYVLGVTAIVYLSQVMMSMLCTTTTYKYIQTARHCLPYIRRN